MSGRDDRERIAKEKFAVRGFSIRKDRRSREWHFVCVDDSCGWDGPTDRWISPSRGNLEKLQRFAWTHANRWHADPPQREERAQ